MTFSWLLQIPRMRGWWDRGGAAAGACVLFLSGVRNRLAMPQKAYIVLYRWDYNDLTRMGKATRCFVGTGGDHIGIRFEGCTPSEIGAHSQRAVGHISALGSRDVHFEYISATRIAFHATSHAAFFTASCEAHAFELAVDAARLHALCVRVAGNNLPNAPLLRLNSAIGGWLPFHTCPAAATPELGPCTCSGLVLRLVAAAASLSDLPLQNDAAALAALGAPSCKAVVTAFTPEEALDAISKCKLCARRAAKTFPFPPSRSALVTPRAPLTLLRA